MKPIVSRLYPSGLYLATRLDAHGALEAATLDVPAHGRGAWRLLASHEVTEIANTSGRAVYEGSRGRLVGVVLSRLDVRDLFARHGSPWPAPPPSPEDERRQRLIDEAEAQARYDRADERARTCDEIGDGPLPGRRYQ